MPRFHNILIQLRNDLGYKREDEGVCVLYAETATDAFLLGEYNAFKKRCNYIVKNYKHLPAFFKRMEEENRLNARSFVSSRGRKTRKKMPYAVLKRPISSQDRNILQEIMAFMDQGELYLNPNLYSDFFGRRLSQAHIKEISSYAQSIAMEKLEGRAMVASFIGVYSQELLINYMEQLNKLAKGSPHDFALGLGGVHHHVGLCYSVVKKSWLFIDVNKPYFPPIPDDDNASLALAELLFNTLGDDDVVGFNTDIYTTGSKKSVMEVYVNVWKQTSNVMALHEVTLEHATRVTSDGITLVWLAARAGDVSLLKFLIGLRPYIDLDYPDNLGVTPLSMAADGGYTEALKVLIEAKMPDGSSRVDITRVALCVNDFKKDQEDGHVEAMEILLSSGASTPEVLHHSSPVI